VDGLIWASSTVVHDSVRRTVPVPWLARWLLGLGIAATLTANVAHGLGHGLIGAEVEGGGIGRLLRTAHDDQSRDSGDHGQRLSRDRVSSGTDAACTNRLRPPRSSPTTVTAGRLPSIRVARAKLHLGQPRPVGARAPRHACKRLGQSRGRASVPGKPRHLQRVCVRGPSRTNCTCWCYGALSRSFVLGSAR
jgi:hypothetical protein